MQEGRRITAGLAQYVERFAESGVLVVGDLMLDEYVTGSVDRISPEAPVPVVSVKAIEHRLGGAANVTHNVRALGAKSYLAGVVGDDGHGRMLSERLEAAGIDGTAVVIDDSRPTSVKTRVIAQKQQIVRYDRESAAPLSSKTSAALLERVIRLLPKVQAVVLSDYAKGVLTLAVCTAAIGSAKGKPVIVDPKKLPWQRYRGATLLKPNRVEAECPPTV